METANLKNLCVKINCLDDKGLTIFDPPLADLVASLVGSVPEILNLISRLEHTDKYLEAADRLGIGASAEALREILK